MKDPLIRAEGLSRIYGLGDAEVVGIHRVELIIGQGELVVLKGDSGSGKSTLLSLLAGLDLPTAGRLRVAGYDLGRIDSCSLTRFRRQVVGMVFQTFNLLPTLSVLENVCLPALLAGKSHPKTQAKALDLLKWLDLTHRVDHLPGQLSGGEMQRTAIARALINDPALILADEPTGNLDSRNGRAVIDLLVQLNRRWHRTVIIATHGSMADRFASVMIRLKDGTIADLLRIS